MIRSKLVVMTALAVAGAAVSCSSDDSSSEGPKAGTGGVARGGTAGSAAGGSGAAGKAGAGSANAGMGGASGGAGGAAAGAAGDDQGGEGTVGGGGATAAGEGGGGGGDVCAGAANVVHPCASVEDAWAPKYDEALKRIELDVSSLPFEVVSGTLNYYFSDGNAHGCGQAQLVVEGDVVRATLLVQDIVPTLVGISLFSLTDACGAKHDFELGDASSCNALQWSADAWACTARPGKCVDQC